MRSFSLFLIPVFLFNLHFDASAQTPIQYEISFENAVHHEAEVSVTFPNLEMKVLAVRMSRTSPGRYALHEFAKNVYNVRAFNSKGEELDVTRPNPHQWDVSGHDGTVIFNYTLFANRGGGTYSGVDETHAHLNMPATFAWAKNYEFRPIEVTFNKRDDLNWKIATQLKHLEDDRYYARDLQYFMDSPTEIADLHFRNEMIDGQNIRLALHTPASETEVDEYFNKVVAIVKEQAAVYGELPAFDYGEYTFLSCYMPNASGDGMEHRNSTYVVSSKAIDKPLAETSIGTISHEFFHAWNVERIRPASLEPFDFEATNMSGELWFAEGFTSYYTGLILARAGIESPQKYIEGLDGGLNRVMHSGGRNFFNPIEMSYQAPFVDAARSVDPTNRGNTFISYYTYGSVLGLGLDLSLRVMEKGLNLDGLMQHMWNLHGKTEVPYTVKDIQSALADYAGAIFAAEFFENYIYDSQLPDYKNLLTQFGVSMVFANDGKGDMGGRLEKKDKGWFLTSNAKIGSPIYKAGIDIDDEFISIGGKKLAKAKKFDDFMKNFKVGEEVEIVVNRFGESKRFTVILQASPNQNTIWDKNADDAAEKLRKDWLKIK